jgi:hypothetical protein
MPQESKISVAIIRPDRYMKIKSKDFWGCENARYIAEICSFSSAFSARVTIMVAGKNPK